MDIAVTGASGFIGTPLCAALTAAGHTVVPIAGAARTLQGLQEFPKGIDVVVHLAARVPESANSIAVSFNDYEQANTHAALHFARQCAANSVRRFVFLSTAKVLGEGRDEPYTDSDLPAPQEPYAVSKLKAEEGLRKIETETGMQVVILRPPLVYGRGAKGNLQRLMGLVARGVPLPLGAVKSRRSVIGLQNLVDLIVVCTAHPRAFGQTFLVADPHDYLMPQLLRLMAQEIGADVRLFSVPVPLLRLAARMLGKTAEVDRLIGSFVVDGSRARGVLDWKPTAPSLRGPQGRGNLPS